MGFKPSYKAIDLAIVAHPGGCPNSPQLRQLLSLIFVAVLMGTDG